MTSMSVSTAGPSENTTVFVSGSCFCMVPSLYQKVEKLRWKKRRDGFLHLSSAKSGAASADAFEVLLQFFMFGKLPETTRMTTRQAGELLKMVQPLLDGNNNINVLAEHVKIIQGAKQEKSKKSTPSFLRCSLPPINLFKASSCDNKGGASSSKQGQDAIDLFDDHNTMTQSNINIFDRQSDCENQQSVMIDDLFGFVEDTAHTVPTIRDCLDNLPVLQVADSTDSVSEVSSMTMQERKVSFSIEESSSFHNDRPRFNVPISNPYQTTGTNHYKDATTTTQNNNKTGNKPASLYDNHPHLVAPVDDSAVMAKEDPAPADATLNSSSFRLLGSTKSSFRNIIHKLQGHDVASTHAEWCSSEYVL